MHQSTGPGQIPYGPDVDPFIESIREYRAAGYDHLYFHQIGPNQEGFFRFWSEDLQPALVQFETKHGGADA